MVWWLLGAVAAAVVAGAAIAVTVDEVWQWFRRKRTASTAYGTVIQERLATGRYRVVTGVFEDDDTCVAAQAWDADELDDELGDLLEDDDFIVVDLWN